MKLALGTVQFGMPYGVANETGQVSRNEANEIVSLAKKENIDVLDTAITYGASEEVLGKVAIDEFRVVTKLPSLPMAQTNIARWVSQQVDDSLRRLRQKQLYGLLLHRPQDLVGSKGKVIIKALIDLKNAGVIQKLGVSIYSPEELDQVYEKTQIDLVQAPINVVDRRLESSGWLDRLRGDGVEVHARSVFLQGLLLMERSKIPEKFSRWGCLWNQWHQSLTHSGTSPVSACLAYPLSLDQVNRVIVGVDSATQLGEILQAVEQKAEIPDTSFMRSVDPHLINPSRWSEL